MRERLAIWLLTVGGVLVFFAEALLLWAFMRALAFFAALVDLNPLAGTLAAGVLLTGVGLFVALRRRHWIAAVINGVVVLGHFGVFAVAFGPILLAKDVTYILKEGFTGEVDIVFQVRAGVAAEVNHGSVTYRIPEDGLLLTASRPLEVEWIRSHYFYQRRDGSLEPLRTIERTMKNRADPAIGVYAESGIGSFSSASGCSFPVTSFRVGTMAQHLDGHQPKHNLDERLRDPGLCGDR